MSSDNVDNPSHYNQTNIPCIDVMETMAFPNLANALKYIWRAGLKGTGSGEEDIDKAVWYVERHFSYIRKKMDARRQSPNANILTRQMDLLNMAGHEDERLFLLRDIVSLDYLTRCISQNEFVVSYQEEGFISRIKGFKKFLSGGKQE